LEYRKSTRTRTITPAIMRFLFPLVMSHLPI
jgi:hypothetical protein